MEQRVSVFLSFYHQNSGNSGMEGLLFTSCILSLGLLKMGAAAGQVRYVRPAHCHSSHCWAAYHIQEFLEGNRHASPRREAFSGIQYFDRLKNSSLYDTMMFV